MSFRCFKRVVWQKARSPGWPDDLEPLATPMDTCRTLAEFDTVEEAREWCADWNDNKPHQRHGVLITKEHRQKAAFVPFAEFTEI